MFMVKSEFANIKSLLSVKFRTQTRNLIWFFALAALMFLSNLAPTVTGIIQNNGAGFHHYNISDLSGPFLFVAIFGFTIMMFMYRNTNNKLSVFPQTNTSRFVTTQIMNYFIVVCMGLTALASYLLSYGTIRVLSVFYENIYFALDFNIGFIAAGFITFLMYGFLAVAVIELIGTLLRKWSYYAAIALVALISLAVTNMTTVIEYTPRVLAFLIGETSFSLFMLKAMGLWTLIVAVSLIINRFTVYYKNQSRLRTRTIAVICIAISVVVTLIVPAVLLYTTNTNVTTQITNVEVTPVDDFIRDFFAGATETRIDISHLPRGSNINFIGGENIAADMGAGGGMVITGMRLEAFVGGMDSLNNIQGDTLIIQFRPPFFQINGTEIMHYTNPRLNAYLDGNVLRIDYNIDTAQVVVLPVWSIAHQFEIFRDRGLVTEQFLGHSAGGSMNANIFIRVE